MMTSINSFTFVVVGGGIAGVSCAEQLAIEEPTSDILLISASPLVKAAINIKKRTEIMEEFDVEERDSNILQKQYPNIHIIVSTVTGLNTKMHELYLSSGEKIMYHKLCLCAGAVPKLLYADNPYVIGLRDTETIETFQKKLSGARCIVIVGNGGIATELVYEVKNCKIIWAVKDKSFGATFFDAGAAEFFKPSIHKESCEEKYIKRTKYIVGDGKKTSNYHGCALGPDWSSGLDMKGKLNAKENVQIEFCCEVQSIHVTENKDDESLNTLNLPDNTTSKDVKWPVYIKLTTGKIFGCDLIISATGVVPNAEPFLKSNKFIIAEDGGIEVNDQMQTSEDDVYAAGDLCHASWELSKHWCQMRLWTQARQMGLYAAKCISANMRGDKALLDICFDIFTHVTHFFGYKVVLLGLYNCQKLGKDCELLVRVTQGEEYVKVVLQNGTMQGAVLIGETDLEETFENLILNQLDLSSYGDDLLNSQIDIEDYFD